MIQWDDTNKVLVDYMGYPISRSEALAFRERIRLHLKKSSADLAAVATNKLKVDMPHYPPCEPEDYE